MNKIHQSFSRTFLRHNFYQYDFFDGTHNGSMPLRYVFRGEFFANWVTRYEQTISQWMELPEAVTFASGRMAFYSILKALKIGLGDEVILPAFTCVVVPNAVIYSGAKPVYVDIDSGTFNIDQSKIEAAITPSTKAILAQHTFGQACDMDPILAIARSHNLYVIEDCAHAIGGKYRNRKLGTLGDAAFASTDHTKIYSTGIGGFAISRRPEITSEIRMVQKEAAVLPFQTRTWLVIQDALLTFLNKPTIYWIGRALVAIGGKIHLWFFFRDELVLQKPDRYPVQLTNFQAYAGYHEIQKLDENVLHRQLMARKLQEFFGDTSKTPDTSAPLRYSLLVRSPDTWETSIGRYFAIRSRWFSSVAHGRKDQLFQIGYKKGSCPNAEYTADHIINFPTHLRADDKMIERLSTLVDTFALRDSILPQKHASTLSRNTIRQSDERTPMENSAKTFALDYFRTVTQLLSELDRDVIARIAEAFESARLHSKTVFFIGNGGSAATASHFANDLATVPCAETVPRFKSISLADSNAAITCLGNDTGYENVFVGQLKNLLEPGDVLVAISASGNSPNIIKAIDYANTQGALTIGFSGFDGGKLKTLSQICLTVQTPMGAYGPVEDIHLMMNHLITSYLRLNTVAVEATAN